MNTENSGAVSANEEWRSSYPNKLHAGLRQYELLIFIQCNLTCPAYEHQIKS